MYSFEGDFRTTPKVSLGGRSKKDSSATVLGVIEKARAERLKREEIRRQKHSYLVLQTSIRSYLVRKKIKSQFRKQFDENTSVLNQSNIVEATKLLCFFYENKVDGDTERLVWLCQNILKHANKYEDWSSIHLLTRILTNCCKNILHADLKQIAIPLRMLEVFTTSPFWLHQDSDPQRFQSQLAFWNGLISKNFFGTMLKVFARKVPYDIDYPDVTSFSPRLASPHQMLAQTLMNITKQPLYFINLTDSLPLIPVSLLSRAEEVCRLILVNFTVDVLCSDQTLLIYNYVIPSLIHDKEFPKSRFLSSVYHSAIGQPHTCLDMKRIYPNLNLLAILTQLFQDFTVENGKMILKCISWLLPLLSSSSSSDEDQDSDDDGSQIPMDLDHNNQSAHEVETSLCSFINSSNFIEYSIKHSSINMPSICCIAYHLLVGLQRHVHITRFLYSLSFSPIFLKNLWNSIVSLKTKQPGSSKRQSSVQQLLYGRLTDSEELMTYLTTFARLYSHNLLSLHDTDFYNSDMSDNHNNAFKLIEIIEIVKLLREICLSLLKKIFPDRRSAPYDIRDLYNQLSSGRSLKAHHLRGSTSVEVGNAVVLFKVCTRLLNQLYTRHTRRSFTDDPNLWISSSLIDGERTKFISTNWRKRNMRNDNIAAHMAAPSDEDLPMTTLEAQQLTTLTCLPFTVAFSTRVSIFTSMLSQDRQSRESPRDFLLQDAGFSDTSSAIQVKVRRDYIYEDAFNDLSLHNAPDLRRVLRVTFVNAAGAEEAGYGQGVTREFFQQLIRTAFDPSRGLFQLTNDAHLWPNPYADRIVEDSRRHYNFLGRLLGKILYEGMQIELRFAAFFLCKLLRSRNADVDINHLQSLDPDFYKNLMYLRSYNGDVSDLDLNFTVVDDRFGETDVTELIPGGQSVSVTNENRVRYIHLLADYKLNVQMRTACDAFREGLSSVLPLEWLRMFDQRELQTLVSGAEVPIDVADMKEHTSYSGGYKLDHDTVKMFWDIIDSFSEEEKRKLLFFVTSCSRPPLLGFKEMYPPFCIHNGGPPDRLPTSSTCLNLLRLPQYNDPGTMKEKILYCIDSQSGFELS